MDEIATDQNDNCGDQLGEHTAHTLSVGCVGTVGQIVVTALFGALFFLSPSIVLAYLGFRRTNSKALPIILLVGSIMSTGLWIILGGSFMAADKVDAQAGMAVMVYFVIQLFLVVLATLSFLLLRNKK